MEQSYEKKEKRILLFVNGVRHELAIGDGPHDLSPSHTLAHTLRENLGLKGTKVGCDHGGCGSCTVLMDGEAILSCMTLTLECDGRSITTIEGLQDEKSGKLDRLQQSFIDHTAFQCGFCTPGIIMASRSLLDKNPSPERQDVQEALAGHFCRCISHYHVVDAVLDAAGKERKRS